VSEQETTETKGATERAWDAVEIAFRPWLAQQPDVVQDMDVTDQLLAWSEHQADNSTTDTQKSPEP
jgi:hypothetical protein